MRDANLHGIAFVQIALIVFGHIGQDRLPLLLPVLTENIVTMTRDFIVRLNRGRIDASLAISLSSVSILDLRSFATSTEGTFLARV